MAKGLKSITPEVITGNKNEATEFDTKVFSKSDHPKTIKKTIKMVLNLFVNFLR